MTEFETTRSMVDVRTTPAAVFAALTDYHQVTSWLASAAEIELENGRYHLSGPDIPDVDHQHKDSMRLTDHQEYGLLTYDWDLFDATTRVAWHIEATEDGSTIAVEHANVPKHYIYILASYWTTTLENLRAWLEHGVRGPRFDFTTLGSGDISVNIEIDASAADVFKQLVDPRQVKRWMMTPAATIQPEPGGLYELAGWTADGPLRVVDIRDNEHLSYSWRSAELGYETLVTWELEESSGRTRLTLMHSGFGPEDDANSYHTGWHNFLVQIKYLTEYTGSWSPVNWELSKEESDVEAANIGS